MTTETTSALMAQLQRERREIAQAWQSGFLCGLTVGVMGAAFLAVPLALWMRG